MLVNAFHVDLASAVYDYRQDAGEATVADGMIAHFNVHQRFLNAVDEDIPDDTFSVPLGLLFDLYEITNVNIDLALTYEYRDKDQIEILYLHTDTQTVLDMYKLKEDFIQRLVEERDITLAQAQNYLVGQLKYLRLETVEDLTLNVAWSVASNIASSDTNGIHSFFIADESNYEDIQENFQAIQAEELYEILSNKLTINSIYTTLEEVMNATDTWLVNNKLKVMSDFKYLYAKVILNRYAYDLALADDQLA